MSIEINRRSLPAAYSLLREQSSQPNLPRHPPGASFVHDRQKNTQAHNDRPALKCLGWNAMACTDVFSDTKSVAETHQRLKRDSRFCPRHTTKSMGCDAWSLAVYLSAGHCTHHAAETRTTRLNARPNLHHRPSTFQLNQVDKNLAHGLKK